MSKWREKYKVHPAAEVFEMLSSDEIDALGDDISANGLKVSLDFQRKAEKDILLDGRNRLEAMERAGLSCDVVRRYVEGDPVAHIVSLNLKRRHLTKEQIADALIALGKIKAKQKPGQADPVSTLERKEAFKAQFVGGRGNKNPIKEEALAINATLPKEDQVSERTLKRSIAKSEGRKPAKPKPTSSRTLKAAREAYAAEFAKLPVSSETAEWKLFSAAVNRAKGKS
jgi:hypothetical protein